MSDLWYALPTLLRIFIVIGAPLILFRLVLAFWDWFARAEEMA
jgi:hypothetical protein